MGEETSIPFPFVFAFPISLSSSSSPLVSNGKRPCDVDKRYNFLYAVVCLWVSVLARSTNPGNLCVRACQSLFFSVFAQCQTNKEEEEEKKDDRSNRRRKKDAHG